MSRRSGALGERWVHLFPFPRSPRSSPFSSLFKTNAGVAWEQIIAACIAASPPFPLLTGVRLQMVNDGISGKDLGKVALEERLYCGVGQQKDLLYTLTVGDLPKPPTIVLLQTLVS